VAVSSTLGARVVLDEAVRTPVICQPNGFSLELLPEAANQRVGRVFSLLRLSHQN
jgi:hypothetical protein